MVYTFATDNPRREKGMVIEMNKYHNIYRTLLIYNSISEQSEKNKEHFFYKLFYSMPKSKRKYIKVMKNLAKYTDVDTAACLYLKRGMVLRAARLYAKHAVDMACYDVKMALGFGRVVPAVVSEIQRAVNSEQLTVDCY